MDQELKQRLIGAAVVTALAAIFIPMLFDDPIDTSGQAVSEMAIPEPPANAPNKSENKLPADAASVENAPGPGNLAGESQTSGDNQSTSPSNPADTERVEPELQEPPIDYEPPAEVDTDLEKRLDQAANGEPVTVPEEQEHTKAPIGAGSAGAPDEPAESAPVQEDSSNNTAIVPKSVPTPTTTKKPPVKPVPAPIKAPINSPADQNLSKPISNKPAVTPKIPTGKTGAGFERWYVQAGSYAKKENAMSQWEALRKQGLPVTLETQATDKGTIYRLKVGPTLSKQRAVDIKARLAQQSIKSIIIAE